MLQLVYLDAFDGVSGESTPFENGLDDNSLNWHRGFACITVENLDDRTSGTCCDFEANATTPFALRSSHQRSDLLRRKAHALTVT